MLPAVEATLAILLVVALVTSARLALRVRRRVRSLAASGPAHRAAMLLDGSLARPGSWPATALRWRLSRDVELAGRAVAHARAGGASVGDLPGLQRRLERLARAEDDALRAAALAPAGARRDPELQRRVGELCAMAAEIHAGAVDALGAETVAGEGRRLAGDIAVEVSALREGRRRLRSMVDGRTG